MSGTPRACILDGPAQRVVYAGPDQSLQSVGRGAANGLPDRIGKNPKTARANIVTWADRRVGHVVDTTREPVAEPRLQRKAPAFDRGELGRGRDGLGVVRLPAGEVVRQLGRGLVIVGQAAL
jgi:hypothetical protein